jgi:hypothetical protein
MNRTVCVVEAYVPGLGERPGGWYEQLQASVAAALRAEGLEIALLAIPNDETLIWLVWGGPGQTDPEATVSAVILREVTGARGVTVIERAVDARFVWRQPGRGGGRGRVVS